MIIGFEVVGIAGFRRATTTVVVTNQAINAVIIFCANTCTDTGATVTELGANTGGHLVAPAIVAAATNANAVGTAILIFNAFLRFNAI
jgi:hypothetical protein